MRRLKANVLAGAFLCAIAPGTIASEPRYERVIPGACTVQARAYVDNAYSGNDKFRYSLDIVPRKGDLYRWDFTPPTEQANTYISLQGGVSTTPYGTRKQVTLPIVLHQYDIHEERVTFENLDLGTIPRSTSERYRLTPRTLALKEAVTRTTPSGISITLPAQGSETLRQLTTFNGNMNALFIQIATTPDQRKVTLPQSPLYRKHRKPVTIKLECAPPHSLIFYKADNTYKTIAVSLPDLRTATHLDKLTLIVRQRAEIRAIPVALQVPITKP